MNLSSKLAGVVFRRSRRADAPALAALMKMKDIAGSGIPRSKTFNVSTEQEFMELIESSVLCVTALSSVHEGMVVGFLALGDVPRFKGIPSTRWEALTQDGLYSMGSKDIHTVLPANTLWLNMMLAPPSLLHITGVSSAVNPVLHRCENEMRRKPYSAEQLGTELLTVALGTSPGCAHVLCALQPGEFSLVHSMGEALSPSMSFAKAADDFSFRGDLIYLDRHAFIPLLDMRLGRIEDYDDFVPLLLKGDGVVTKLPCDFFLEEILKDQNDTHKVVIAENPITHQVVGLACLRVLTLEEQQMLTRQYTMDVVGKLKALLLDEEVQLAKSAVPPGANMSNTFMIDFLYYNNDYDGSAADFVPFMFRQFPMCEYTSIVLPHSTDEPPVLGRFQYLPVRKYQPHNARGESLPVPEGLWVCCRYSLQPVQTHVVRFTEECAMVEQFFQSAHHGMTSAIMECIRDDLIVSHEKEKISVLAETDPLPTTTVFQLSWRSSAEIVGVASARRMTVSDMYAIRSNFDIDEHVYFYARTGKNYEATDISLSPKGGSKKFHTQEMRGIVIRAMYVRPAFRNSIRLFVREMMRRFGAQVAIVLATLEDEPFPQLLKELVPARPRRVVERPPKLSSDEPEEYEPINDTSQTVSPKTTASSPNVGHDANAQMSASAHRISAANKSALNKGGSGTLDGQSDGASVCEKDIAPLSALFYATPRCLGDELKRVHTRIVVVGASATGLSLLQRLLMVPYARFTNLLLVSTDGMPAHPNQEDCLWQADHMELLEREHISLMVGRPIRVVAGTMADLDKVNKFISIDNGTFEPYDYLILATGRQYIAPPSIRRLQQQEGRPTKAGVIALSGEFAADRLRHRLNEIDQNQNNFANVIVYGSGLDAFAAVTAIVNLGFSAQRVVVCSPVTEVPMMDEECYKAGVALLKAMGTNVLRGFDVNRMEYDDDNNLTTVMLSPIANAAHGGGSAYGVQQNASNGNNNNRTHSSVSAAGSVELACCLIVCLEEKDIDANVLSALNKRSIVFDGRVIVENNYLTTDPFVFAAGPVAMFTRRYGATQSFDDFNARDVGFHLAKVLMGYMGYDEFFDPKFHTGGERSLDGAGTNNLYTKVLEENGSRIATARGQADAHEEMSETAALETLHRLPKYSTPLARRVRFPAGYNFFSAVCVNFDPTRCLRLDCSSIDLNNLYEPEFLGGTDAGEDSNHAVCGDMEKTDACLPPLEQNYFALYVNANSRAIDGVMYFGNGEPEVHNYYSLIGCPESLLTLLFRYSEAIKIAEEHPNEKNIPGIGLTAGIINGRLDLMNYLRLPHLNTIFYDRFVDFFNELREKMRTHEEAIKMREKVLRDHQLDSDLTGEQIDAYKEELTTAQSEFKYQVQLELIKFLHEHKDFRIQNMYLPNVRSLVAQ